MADEIKVTVLVDNYIDIFLPSTALVRYPTPGKESRLWGEQGLSLWIEVRKGGKTLRFLYDFGRSDRVLFHNAPLLGVDLCDARFLVLSHAHGDHYGGLSRVLRSTAETCRLVVHPGACGIRRFVKHDDSVAGPWGLTGRLLRAFQKRVTASDSMTALGFDTHVSGGIERRTFFEKGMPNAFLEENGVLVPDPIADDQALFIELSGRKLVVVTGCAHAGIVNTLAHAEQVFPGRSIHAVIGGFHLNNAGDAQMRETIACFKRLNVRHVTGLHCTGYHAQKALMDALKERWMPGTVGMRITLRGE